MSPEVATALVGGATGIIGALSGAALQGFVSYRSEQRRQAHEEEAQRRTRYEALVRRYLFQLQDAVEALWHRVYNLRHEYGEEAMTPPYLVATTIYALGRVLAAERVLTLEGVYPRLGELHRELGETLRNDRLFLKLGFRDFQQYDRLALAEAVLERDEGGGFRPSTYLAFHSRYMDGASPEATWLERAKAAVGSLAKSKAIMDEWLALLGKIARQTSDTTGIPTSIEEKEKFLESGRERS
jgi:hypothetical protein